MRRLLVSALLCSLPFAAHAGLFDDDVARQQAQQAAAQVEQLKQENAQLQDKVQKLEKLVGDLKVTEILNQLEATRAEVAKIRGQQELATYQTDQLQKRQKDFYTDLDARLRSLEGGKAPKAAAVQNPPAPAATPTPPQDDQAYQQALGKYKAGDYTGAISGFQDFIKQNTAHKLVPNAYYWLGFTQAANKDCKSAIQSQQTLLQKFPDSSKTPDALLNLASCQNDVGDKTSARKTLEQLVAKYPLTPAGEQGKKQLAK